MIGTDAALREYEFIFIVLRGVSPSKKTALFDVHNRNGNAWLGEIKWYARWRQYAFFPRDNTIYSAGCARDIADFIDSATLKQKRKAAMQ